MNGRLRPYINHMKQKSKPPKTPKTASHVKTEGAEWIVRSPIVYPLARPTSFLFYEILFLDQFIMINHIYSLYNTTRISK